MPTHPEHQFLSESTEPRSRSSQEATTHVVREEPHGADPRDLSRLVVCAIAVGVAAIITLEPYVIDTPPGLQAFQAIFMLWFWGLFMFGGATAPPDRRE